MGALGVRRARGCAGAAGCGGGVPPPRRTQRPFPPPAAPAGIPGRCDGVRGSGRGMFLCWHWGRRMLVAPARCLFPATLHVTWTFLPGARSSCACGRQPLTRWPRRLPGTETVLRKLTLCRFLKRTRGSGAAATPGRARPPRKAGDRTFRTRSPFSAGQAPPAETT